MQAQNDERSYTLADKNYIGGVFVFADAVTDIYDSNKRSYPLALTDGTQDETDRSWFARYLYEVTERWTSKARQNTEGDKLHILLEEHGGFEVLGMKEYFSPLNWDGGDMANGAEIGKLMLLNIHVSISCALHVPSAYTLLRISSNRAVLRYLPVVYPATM